MTEGGLLEAEEFDAFYAMSFSRLVNQVHAMIGDRDEAQDCVQEAFVRAWSHRRKLDGAGSPEAWVLRITGSRPAPPRRDRGLWLAPHAQPGCARPPATRHAGARRADPLPIPASPG